MDEITDVLARSNNPTTEKPTHLFTPHLHLILPPNNHILTPRMRMPPRLIMIHGGRIRRLRIPPKLPIRLHARPVLVSRPSFAGIALEGVEVAGARVARAVRPCLVEHDIAGFEALEEGAAEGDGGGEEGVAEGRLLPAEHRAEGCARAVAVDGRGVVGVVQD